jgi:hypothetical protein
MIGQFGDTVTRPENEIMLALDLSSRDPSMKLGSCSACFEKFWKTRGGSVARGVFQWHRSQMRFIYRTQQIAAGRKSTC